MNCAYSTIFTPHTDWVSVSPSAETTASERGPFDANSGRETCKPALLLRLSSSRQPFEYVGVRSLGGSILYITCFSGSPLAGGVEMFGSWLQNCQNGRSKLSRKGSLGRSRQARTSQSCVSVLHREKGKTNDATGVAVAGQSAAPLLFDQSLPSPEWREIVACEES